MITALKYRIVYIILVLVMPLSVSSCMSVSNSAVSKQVIENGAENLPLSQLALIDCSTQGVAAQHQSGLSIVMIGPNEVEPVEQTINTTIIRFPEYPLSIRGGDIYPSKMRVKPGHREFTIMNSVGLRRSLVRMDFEVKAGMIYHVKKKVRGKKVQIWVEEANTGDKLADNSKAMYSIPSLYR